MPKSPLDNLQSLRLLEEILRTGQLSAAAEALLMNVATASRQLNDLRSALCDELFVRNGKGLVPTARMLTLRPIVRQILQNVEALANDDVFSPERATGTFRILTYDNALLLYIFPALPAIRCKAPELNLEFGFVATTEQLIDELRRGEADLAIFPVPPKRSDMIAIDLDAQHYRLLMRQNHPLSDQRIPINAVTLRPYTQLMPGSRPIRPWTTLRDEGQPSIVIPYFNTAPFLVLETDFIMWIPSRTAEYWLARGGYAVRDLPPELAYAFSPKLIWNTRSDGDPLHQWVRSLVAAHHEAGSELSEK